MEEDSNSGMPDIPKSMDLSSKCRSLIIGTRLNFHSSVTAIAVNTSEFDPINSNEFPWSLTPLVIDSVHGIRL